MKKATRNGNGRKTSSPPRSGCHTRTGRSAASATAPRYDRLSSRPPATGTTTSNAVSSSVRASRFRIDGGIPSASDGQKRRPYSRIDSATSWPTVRSAGGSGGGSADTVRDGTVPGRGLHRLLARHERLAGARRRLGQARRALLGLDDAGAREPLALSLRRAREAPRRPRAGGDVRDRRRARRRCSSATRRSASTSSPGSVVVVQPGTPLQIRNDGADEAMLFIVGAPPEQGGIDFFPTSTTSRYALQDEQVPGSGASRRNGAPASPGTRYVAHNSSSMLPRLKAVWTFTYRDVEALTGGVRPPSQLESSAYTIVSAPLLTVTRTGPDGVPAGCASGAILICWVTKSSAPSTAASRRLAVDVQQFGMRPRAHTGAEMTPTPGVASAMPANRGRS